MHFPDIFPTIKMRNNREFLFLRTIKTPQMQTTSEYCFVECTEKNVEPFDIGIREICLKIINP